MRRRSLAWVALLWVGATFTTGCQEPGGPAEPSLEPPYTRTSSGALTVRPDLLPLLRFASVERTELRATLQGVGKVALAPGASDAVRRPVAAYVERVLVNVGQPVLRGTPRADAAFLPGDPGAVVVRAAFPEREAPLLAAGAPCSFAVLALGSDRYEGELIQVAQAVDPATHTVAATCRPRVVDPRLRAEMVARVEVAAHGAPARLIPRGAMLLHGDERVVFVWHDNTLERRPIEAGAQLGDRVQVLRGLAVGEVVVSENAVLLDGELDRLL